MENGKVLLGKCLLQQMLINIQKKLPMKISPPGITGDYWLMEECN
jgi:hypothetical protein